MLTDDARRTTHDDGRQPIAIGHLSDSGDLIKDLQNQLVNFTFHKASLGEWN